MKRYFGKITLILSAMVFMFSLLSFPATVDARVRSVKKIEITCGAKKITKKTITLEEGKTLKVKVKVKPASAKKSISFKSSNRKIVTVKKGVLTALKTGTCKIKVTVKGKNKKKKTSWFKVTVTKKDADTSSEEPLKILMIGNSYTYCNDLPKLLAKELNADVQSRAVGAACLADHCESFFDDDIGHETLRLLNSRKWDYVILQEQSSTPFFAYDSFSYGAGVLSKKIRDMGATPVLYGTWAYEDGSTALTQTGCTHAQMYELLHEAFLKVSEENRMIFADVGAAFYKNESMVKLYDADGSHPSLEGSELAAKVIAGAISGQ